MTKREAFEAWFRTQPSACHTLRMSDHGPHAGEYIAIGVEREWRAFQAGRLAGFAEALEMAAKECTCYGIDDEAAISQSIRALEPKP